MSRRCRVGDRAGSPAARARWLYIARARFVWLARQQLCVTITLAAPPRADSSYTIDLEQTQGAAVEEDVYGSDINGVGDLIPQLRDSSSWYARGKSSCPTGFGEIGRQLELIISPGDRVFGQKRAIGADVYAESLEPGEPLLHHPLDASDSVPGGSGLKLPVRGRQMPRCVAFHAP